MLGGGFSTFCERTPLEYVRIRAIYTVNQAEYGIHILVLAPQEYVDINSTRRINTRRWECDRTRSRTHDQRVTLSTKGRRTQRRGRQLYASHKGYMHIYL